MLELFWKWFESKDGRKKNENIVLVSVFQGVFLHIEYWN